MKKFLFLLLMFCSFSNLFSQTIIENVGTASGTLAISANVFSTAYQFSGTADTRSTSVSSGYAGASGGRNVFMTNSGTSTFQIANVLTNGCTGATLQFGIWKNTAAGSNLTISNFIVETSIDAGGSWNALSWGSHTAGATWVQSTSVALPIGNLLIRFRNTSTTIQARLDDITIKGTGPCENSLLLPIVLNYFNVEKNKLSFQTASESNNSHFEIERSSNGKSYETIGRVEGNGTTQSVHNYTFTDNSPAKGTNYYRLKQVDFDGRFDFSKVVTSYFGEKTLDANVLLANNENMKVNVFSAENTEATIQLIDMNGREVFSYTTSLNEKDNLVTFSPNLQLGMYVLKVQTSVGQQVSKIVAIK